MSKQVTVDEIIKALEYLYAKRDLVERIRQHGIAPPDGWVLVPVKQEQPPRLRKGSNPPPPSTLKPIPPPNPPPSQKERFTMTGYTFSIELPIIKADSYDEAERKAKEWLEDMAQCNDGAEWMANQAPTYRGVSTCGCPY